MLWYMLNCVDKDFSLSRCIYTHAF